MRLLFFLAIFTSTLLSAQNFDFEFSTFVEEYSELTAPIPLNANGVWDDPNWSFPIGFNFQYDGEYYTHLRFGGFNSYGGELELHNPGFDTPNVDYIFPFAQDLRDINFFTEGAGPGSEVGFQVEGALGNRIMKLEWKNVGFYGDGGSTVTYNLQMWLYESGGNIEFRYGGGENIVQGTLLTWNGVFVGLGTGYNEGAGNSIERLLYLEGDIDNPTASITGDLVEEDVNFPMLNDYPESGRVYSFGNLVSIAEQRQAEPVLLSFGDNVFQLTGIENEEPISIYNTSGVLIQQLERTQEAVLNLQGLAAGLYLVHVGSQGSAIKVMVQ